MSRTRTLALFLLSFGALSAAQDTTGSGIRGAWRTPGGAVVQIASCGTDVCATLVQLEPSTTARVDESNPDPAQRGRKLCGLQIGYGFHSSDPNHAEDGHLYDPKSGKTYRGAMVSNGNRLSLRGYVGIKAFGRTEEWSRTAEPQKVCS